MKETCEKVQHFQLYDAQFSDVLKDYEEFVYIVSHDFSAPIRHVNEFVKLLTQSVGDINKNQELYIHYIQSALKRMSDMQSSLLTLSRLTSAQHRFDNIDTNCMVSNIIDNLDFNEYETRPDILCDNLSPVHGVNTMIEMLFSEIIDNACRYGSSNGTQKVIIKCYERDAEIVFEVQDNGIGIDTAFTEVIFNMFRRLHGQDDYGGRIGAGLTISKRIVAHHKGHIWIKSKLDEGTSVLFSLPKKSSIA